jgi:sugar lactone lactonase YvrE
MTCAHVILDGLPEAAREEVRVPKTARIALDGLGAPESLRWRDGALWFSDLACGRGSVHRWVPGQPVPRQVAEIPGRAGGLGWLPDGRLLVVSMDRRCVYRQEPDGTLAVHADISHLAGGPANDMYVDAAGRAYVGNFGFDLYSFAREHASAEMYAPPGPPAARIACLAADGSLLGTSPPVLFPNGIVEIAPGRLVVAETTGLRLTEFPVGRDGVLGDGQPWAPLVAPTLWRLLTSPGIAGAVTRKVSSLLDHPAIAKRSSSPVAPDGITLHHDGETIWVANSLRGECVRVERGGRILDRLRTSQYALCCALGGEGGRTLFIATVPDADPAEAGRLGCGRIEVDDL